MFTKVEVPSEMVQVSEASGREHPVRTVFFFGAGASAGSVDCDPTLPPLGGALFDELARQGEVATKLTPALKELFRQSFEQGMEQLCVEQPKFVPYLLREMALYFSRFTPGKRSVYHNLAAIVGPLRTKVVLSTINYELLIEHALAEAGNVPSYDLGLHSSRDVRLLKIHGSCSFLPAPSFKFVFRDIDFTGAGKDGLADFPFTPVTRQRDIETFCREQSLAPAMCMFLRGKAAAFGGSGINAHLLHWQNAVRRAERVWIIGVRVNEDDGHIWNTLAESQGKLLYVGPAAAAREFRSWSERRGRSGDETPADSFLAAIPIIESDLRQQLGGTTSDQRADAASNSNPSSTRSRQRKKRDHAPRKRSATRPHDKSLQRSAVDLVVARNWFGNTNGRVSVAGTEIFCVETMPGVAEPLVTLDLFNQFGDRIAALRRNKLQGETPWLWIRASGNAIELRKSTDGLPFIKARNLGGGVIEVSHVFLYTKNRYFIVAQTKGETSGLDVWRIRPVAGGSASFDKHILRVTDATYRGLGRAIEITANGQIRGVS